MRIFFSLILIAFGGLALEARPNLDQPMAASMLDHGSAYYRVETLPFTSIDGERAYRVYVAIPKREAPESGFPVLYLLDGNASLPLLTDDVLAELAPEGLPAIVAIGSPNGLRLDPETRAYDYTARAGQDPHGRATGGADAFLELIETRIQPAVAEQVSVDPARQTLWGHSYGGLFVLHTLFTHPEAFTRYAAASPSLWLDPSQMAADEAAFAAKSRSAPVPLLLMAGTAEDGRGHRKDHDPHARQKFVQRLHALDGLNLRFVEFEGLGHGPMFNASLLRTLQWLAPEE
ncbi:MAG: esterase [Puniceicoccaceae bacterium 5H]|nr:MAG: esterase [Puniceicoccaceae bacterium 5H]